MSLEEEGDSGGKKNRHGKRCVAMHCGNTNRDGVSLHEFPWNNPQTLRQWVAFVKMKRGNWAGPSKFSVLCEEHFDSENAYPIEYRLRKEMGLTPVKKKLLIDAVPTVHKQPPAAAQPIAISPAEGFSPEITSTPKRRRMAYVKRENQRIFAEFSQPELHICSNTESVDVQTTATSSTATSTITTEHDLHDGLEAVNCTVEAPRTATVGTQFGHKIPRRSKKIQVKPNAVDKVCQTLPKKTYDIGVQCDIKREDPKPLEIDHDMEESMDFSFDSEGQTSPHCLDESYIPSGSEDSLASSDNDSFSCTETKRYIVEEEQLMKLFEHCPKCGNPSLAYPDNCQGTMVKVNQECGACGYQRVWCNMGKHGSFPTVNILLSAAILFTGSLPSKVLKLFSFLSIACICKDTFMRHQRSILHPAVSRVWERFQQDYLSNIVRRGEALVLGGDGRADSPGHSAKFGSYSMLDLDKGVVLDVQIVQSNEVKSSVHMEKEGLRRSLEFLKEKKISIKNIVTDRHVQIIKFLRENYPDVGHFFDVWHVAKGLKKRLLALSKEKECSSITEWMKSISNHMYWVAASSREGEGDIMWVKWESLFNHVRNIHTGHGDLYPDCAHGSLAGRKKKWLDKDSKLCGRLYELLHTTQMKKDIPKLSPGYQTSQLEGFHSVIIHFAPKMMGFSFHSMVSRIIIAALHFNENGNRSQAVSNDGKLQFNIVFPKYKKGGYTVRQVKTPCTYNYVHQLLSEVMEIARKGHLDVVKMAPPPLCSDFTHPDKDTAILEHSSRFMQVAGIPGNSRH